MKNNTLFGETIGKNSAKNELVEILNQMETHLKEFEALQKISNACKQNLIKLSDKKLKELENKYKSLSEKMAELNQRAKKIKND